MKIKEREIGKGRPLVCVPIVETERHAICREAEKLVQESVDMVEWRIDWYENGNSPDEVCKVIEELAGILKRQILLCTFRSKKQGGEKEIQTESYLVMLEKIADQGKADMIDVEVCELQKPAEIIEKLKEKGMTVVASDHNFLQTPSVEIMTEKLLYMKRLGADIAKLAVMPNSTRDVLSLLEATVGMKEQYPQYPVITMSMGAKGMISRIAGQAFGSCVTFAASGKTSAPGQMPVEDVVMILDKVSESMEK